jgi:hypothetical protein
MNISYIFGLIAGIAALITYGLYFKQILKGQSTPNPSTWVIWLLIGIINAITYFSVTNNNLWQSFIVFAVTFSVCIVFIYSLFKGKFSKISKTEIIVFIIAITIGIFWQITSNDRISNLLLQGIYIISYIPTINGIIKKTCKEYYVSWIGAFIAYLFSTISVGFDPKVDWIAFVHPIVNGLLGNGIVAGLIIYKKYKNKKIPS